MIWLPGGYPELHAGTIAGAQHFLTGVQCGGLYAARLAHHLFEQAAQLVDIFSLAYALGQVFDAVVIVAGGGGQAATAEWGERDAERLGERANQQLWGYEQGGVDCAVAGEEGDSGQARG